MCWQMDIHLQSMKGKSLSREALLGLLEEPLQLTGEWPGFQLHDGHCLCDFFRKDGQAGSVVQAIACLAEHPGIKKVGFVRFWNEKSDSLPKEKVSLQEFRQIGEIRENVLYEVMDHSQFSY